MLCHRNDIGQIAQVGRKRFTADHPTPDNQIREVVYDEAEASCLPSHNPLPKDHPMSPRLNRTWVHAIFLSGFCLLLPGLPLTGATALAAPDAVAPTGAQQTPPSPDAAAAATAKRNANLRQGPGTNFPIVGGVTAGQTLAIVAANPAGDWYQLADGRWIFAALVEGAPAVAVSAEAPAAPAAPESNPAPEAAAAPAGGWSLVADSAADFPGGRDRNHWYYLWTEGRGNFVWQEMRQTDGKGCYHDTADKGLEICADSLIANPKGDVGLQWKASRGGAYRFEWNFPMPLPSPASSTGNSSFGYRPTAQRSM
jgi:hypothetical protein